MPDSLHTEYHTEGRNRTYCSVTERDSAVIMRWSAVDNDIGVIGVTPGANLWAVKVLGRNGSSYLSDVIDGMGSRQWYGSH